jgi:hypothetical protein
MRGGAFALVGLLGLVGVAPGGPVATSQATVTLVRVPHGGIQPEVVTDGRGVLHLIYFTGDPKAGDLFYTRSTDSGSTFSPAVRVNSQQGSAIAVGTIRGGQLALGRDGRVHVAWNGSDAARPRGLVNPVSGQLSAPFLYARSNVQGTSFEPQRDLAKRTYDLDGGGSIAADPGGNVYAAWHALAAGGESGEDRRRVWIARSTDDGATFADEQPAWKEPTGACGCCGLRMLAGSATSLYVLYRSATSLTHRDIYLLEATGRGRSFRGSLVQGWDIDACPMSSMAIASAASHIFGAWETAGQVYVGEIDTNAARIPAPTPVTGAAGTRKHPRLAANANGNLLVVWTEGTAWARGGSLAWQAFDVSGHPTTMTGKAPGVGVWSFAAPAARRDGGFVIFY